MFKDIMPGDIVITRNEGDDREYNTSPGYWNHAAIYTGDGFVEAQPSPNEVILSNKYEFYRRYPRIRVYRLNEDKGKMATAEARKLLGSRYRKLASMFRFLRRDRRGENCVSVVRKAYSRATGTDYKWSKPDDIANDPNLTMVDEKNEIEDTKPYYPRRRRRF